MDLGKLEHYGIPILAMITGLVCCFFGKKIFKPVLFLAGVVSAGGITYLLLRRYYPDFSERDLVSVGAALVGGFLAILVFKIGIFLIGTFVGYFLGVVLFTIATEDLGMEGANNDTFRYFMLSILGSTGGAVALRYELWIIIISTAVCGSFGTFVGVDMLWKQGLFEMLQYVFLNNQKPNSGYELYVTLGGIAVLALIGGYYQRKFLKDEPSLPSKKKKTTSRNEEESPQPKAITIELK